MALFTKTILNLNMIGDKSLAAVESDCLEHFGKGLYQSELVRLEHESDFSELCGAFNYDNGNPISINSDCICYEKRIILLDSKYTKQLEDIAFAYMDAELGKHVVGRESEYINFMIKVFNNCSVKYMDIKVFKIGEIIYYGYSI